MPTAGGAGCGPSHQPLSRIARDVTAAIAKCNIGFNRLLRQCDAYRRMYGARRDSQPCRRYQIPEREVQLRANPAMISRHRGRQISHSFRRQMSLLVQSSFIAFLIRRNSRETADKRTIIFFFVILNSSEWMLGEVHCQVTSLCPR